ncbi:MAG: hypothetical protein KUG81_09400 [Gammaproteobacteria bacterium]|nr:hypothetical protein [Gammaproteobacteria bacterium]
MAKIPEEDRSYLTEIRAIATDLNGDETLVGLTEEETEFYLDYSRRSVAGSTTDEDRDRYVALNDKHEPARIAVISAESELRVDKPSKH